MERKLTPDVLKGIAVILMIQVHLTELFATGAFYESIAGKISLFMGGPPAAPVFMVVMGYFLAFTKKSMMAQVLRGFKLLLLGLALNILLNAHAITHIFTGEIDLNPFHLIFGADILFLAGFSVIIIALLKSLLQKHYLIPFILSLLVACCAWFFNNLGETDKMSDYFIALVGGNFSWSYFPIFPWFAYPLAGFGFKLFEEKFPIEKFQKRIYLTIAIVITILLAITFRYGVFKAADLKNYYHHDFVYAAWVFGFLICWSVIVRFLCRKFKTSKIIRTIAWVGENVTAFYFIQWIIIGNIATAIYKTQEWQMLLIWFISITSFSILIVWFWNKFIELRNRDRVL